MQYPALARSGAVQAVNTRWLLGAIVTLGVALTACGARNAVSSPLPLKAVAESGLSGTTSRLDYQSADAARGLLFIAHLGDSSVIVFDMKQRRVIATIPSVDGVHGVLVLPELRTVFASATASNMLVAIDEVTLKERWRTGAGVYPDGIAYDPNSKHLFVSDEQGGTDTVLDARSGAHVATIALNGEVGNTQFDPVTRHIFVNAEGANQLVEIDPRTNQILRKVVLRGCAGNHGLLIDERNRRAFVACEDNATLLWIDIPTMQVRQHWPVGASPDVLALDPHHAIIYVAAESGVIALFSDGGADVTKIAQGFFAPAAHTVYVDPVTSLTYWPLQNSSGRPVVRVAQYLAR